MAASGQQGAMRAQSQPPRESSPASAEMASRGDLTDFERGLIVGARLGGASVSKAAGMAGVSRGTVSKVMCAWEREGKTTSAKGNCGRKRLVSARDARALVQLVRRNRHATAEELWAKFNAGREQRVSLKTVRRELHRAGYYWQGAEHRGTTWAHLEDKVGAEAEVANCVPGPGLEWRESQLVQGGDGPVMGQEVDCTELRNEELFSLGLVTNMEQQAYHTPRRGHHLAQNHEDPVHFRTEASQGEEGSADRGKGQRKTRSQKKETFRSDSLQSGI